MTETQTLTFRSLEHLKCAFERYVAEGWRMASEIRQQWSWKRFSLVIALDVYRITPNVDDQVFNEVINNQSAINSRKQTFEYRNRKGFRFRKEMYYDPNTFDTNKEFIGWKRQIIAQHRE